MDKYTYSLKVEKIGKLVRQEDYAQAAKIADTMEWGQERNVRLLTAVGEAYDKVARVVGLGYPGGPKVDKAARDGDPEAIHFKRVYLEKDSLDFSFSGLKTQVLNYINHEKMAGREINVPDLAASFQQSILDVLVDKAMLAAEFRKADRLVMAGGVAANSRLRKQLSDACAARGITLYAPEPVLCTDNGAMIASAAYYKYKKQGPDDLHLDAYANLPL